MGRASEAQHAFNTGEISPLLFGRQDLDKYASSLASCFNAIPLAQGPWTRRPGFLFLAGARHNDKVCRLFPFQYSVDQTYVIEIGNQYARFITNHGVLVTTSARSITGVTKANPAVLTYSGTDIFSNDQRVYVDNMTAGMTQIDRREFVVKNLDTTANTFELYDVDGNKVDSTNYSTFTVGGSVQGILEVSTPYVEADLARLRITQSADTLFLTHPDYQDRKLVRNSATSWTLSVNARLDGPYDSLNTTTTTLSPSAATGTVTITASAVTGINSDAGFLSGDVGRHLRLREGSTWGWAKILTVGSTVSVTADVISTLTNTNAKVNWRLGIYSDTTGWPAVSTFHDDRLWFAGADLYPQRLDGSKSSDYLNFAPSAYDGTVADDNAVAFTLNADDVNAVRWLASDEKGLLVGTARAEWQVKASSLNEALTPTNISGKPSTRHGSADIAPARTSPSVLFVQRAGRKLREFAYVFEKDGFRAPDMTLLAEHITQSGIVELAYQEQPQAILWAVRDDGTLIGFTYERDQNVTGWHRHEIGGYSNAGHTAAPLVESIACVPSPDGTRDELYAVIKRYINGGTKRYIERMSKIWESGDEKEDAVYTDCGFTKTEASSATLKGLWFLEGETVGVMVDGAAQTEKTVANGQITLDRAGAVKTAGYFYNSDGATVPLEGGAQDGSAQAKTKSIGRVGLWLMDTLGLKIGRSEAETANNEIVFREWGDDYGDSPALFSGVKRFDFEGDYSRDPRVYWRCDGPYPATVLSLMTQFDTSDDS